jgi:hypothetical protein
MPGPSAAEFDALGEGAREHMRGEDRHDRPQDDCGHFDEAEPVQPS